MRALEIRQVKFGPDHPFTADILRPLAAIYSEARKFEESEKYYKKSLEIRLKYGEMNGHVAGIYNGMAVMYMDQKKYGLAEECLKKAYNIRKVLLGPKHSRTGQTLKHLASLYEKVGKFQESLDCAQQALEITVAVFGKEHFHATGILLRLGRTYMAMKQYSEAEKYLTEGFVPTEKKFGDHLNTSDFLIEFGKLAHARKEGPTVYRPYLERAAKIRKQAFGEKNEQYLSIVRLLEQSTRIFSRRTIKSECQTIYW